jgi:Kdo2-lipid IVA lauroyltransferase/acyltransferase
MLPFFILYRASDFIYFLLYYVFGYRKEIVLYNLSIAFPEKTAAEKKTIAKQFYKSLIDSFIETVKMLSMSKSQFEKRCTSNTEVLDDIIASGKSIQLHSGHQMNWEYVNWIMGKNLSIPFIGIYQPIGNAAINKIFYKIRARYGTKLISTKEFKTKVHTLFKQQYSIGLAADQNTPHANGAYWLYFFTKPVPFVTGPDKGAIKNKTAVAFVKFVKKKRGHYHFDISVITKDASVYKEGELTRIYRDFLEETIQDQPANYLWSHRRYRHDYFKHYEHLWVDNRPAP